MLQLRDGGIQMNEPPILLYLAIEWNRIEPDDEEPFIHVFNYPFATREEAERERDSMLRAVEHYEEEEGEPPYAEHGATVQEVKLTKRTLQEASQMSQESFDIQTAAADAVAEGLLASEGIELRPSESASNSERGADE